MRIIGGSARGVRLQSHGSEALRPMLDRVKEALFNIVRAGLPGARVLDLFSGSGALGLEALSLGAESCTFVEQDADLVALIAANAERCRLAERCRIVQADALSLAARPPPAGGAAELALVDPPYAMVDDPNRRTELFQSIERLLGTWLSPSAVVMVHHRPMPHALWPVTRLVEGDRRIYGRSQLTFFEAGSERGDESE